MPTGSFEIGSTPPSLYAVAPQAVVSFYDADEENMTVLPNVPRACASTFARAPIRRQPRSGTSRTTSSPTPSAGRPSSSSSGRSTRRRTTSSSATTSWSSSVTNPDGSLWIPFDGFASIPQVDYSAQPGGHLRRPKRRDPLLR